MLLYYSTTIVQLQYNSSTKVQLQYNHSTTKVATSTV